MAQEAPKAKTAAAAADVPAASAGGGWMPIIVVLVAVPVLSFVMAEFVLFPRLEQRLTAVGAVAAAPAGAHAPAAAGGQAAGAPAEAATFSHEFKNIVSNLAGSMKSRYIKVTFTAYGSNPKFAELIEANKAKLLDTTLSVLGGLNLADLEDTAIKNRVRTSLVQAYQTVLRDRLIEEVYFSEFVIQ